ncbi:hypothetical protein [Methylomonas koyamae]|uniref:hypothetical protein n=1 Tax=Methylomonas koyamae TaxID=702114 RepID=UPI00278C2C98|nr:hypothetical protein [Methylomonas koyamae]
MLGAHRRAGGHAFLTQRQHHPVAGLQSAQYFGVIPVGQPRFEAAFAQHVIGTDQQHPITFQDSFGRQPQRLVFTGQQHFDIGTVTGQQFGQIFRLA